MLTQNFTKIFQKNNKLVKKVLSVIKQMFRTDWIEKCDSEPTPPPTTATTPKPPVRTTI